MQLGWMKGTWTLPQSHGVMTVPPGARALVRDEDLNAIARRCGCASGSFDGYVRFYRRATLRYVYDSGQFVGDRDWGTVDPWFLLQSIRTQARELVGTKYTTIYGSTSIVGWGARPSYDRRLHAVTFMVRTVGGAGRDNYDARALVLGRYGVETIIAETHFGDGPSTWHALQRGVASFHFPVGYRYADHRDADRTGHVPISLLLEMDAGAKLTPVPNREHIPQTVLDLSYVMALFLGACVFIFALVRRGSRRAKV